MEFMKETNNLTRFKNNILWEEEIFEFITSQEQDFPKAHYIEGRII